MGRLWWMLKRCVKFRHVYTLVCTYVFVCPCVCIVPKPVLVISYLRSKCNVVLSLQTKMYASASLIVCMYICLLLVAKLMSVCLSVCLSVRPSIRPSVRPSAYLSVWLPAYLSACVHSM